MLSVMCRLLNSPLPPSLLPTIRADGGNKWISYYLSTQNRTREFGFPLSSRGNDMGRQL